VTTNDVRSFKTQERNNMKTLNKSQIEFIKNAMIVAQMNVIGGAIDLHANDDFTKFIVTSTYNGPCIQRFEKSFTNYIDALQFMIDFVKKDMIENS